MTHEHRLPSPPPPFRLLAGLKPKQWKRLRKHVTTSRRELTQAAAHTVGRRSPRAHAHTPGLQGLLEHVDVLGEGLGGEEPSPELPELACVLREHLVLVHVRNQPVKLRNLPQVRACVQGVSAGFPRQLWS